ncbi:unnamed protein product [Scytosiphon promiscuus]
MEKGRPSKGCLFCRLRSRGSRAPNYLGVYISRRVSRSLWSGVWWLLETAVKWSSWLSRLWYEQFFLTVRLFQVSSLCGRRAGSIRAVLARSAMRVARGPRAVLLLLEGVTQNGVEEGVEQCATSRRPSPAIIPGHRFIGWLAVD